MSTAIDAAVVAALQADATLAGLATGGVWPDLAPEQNEGPYVLVVLDAHEDVHELGQTAFERATYLVLAVHRSTDAASANAVYNQAHAVLTGSPLTVTGYTVMDVKRVNRERSAERDGISIWRFVGGRYVVEADPS